MNTALTDPFFLRFEHSGQSYSAKVVYAKAAGSCENIFDIELMEPQSGKFNLREKPDDFGIVNEPRIWIDQQGFASDLYQVIGENITAYMKERLGVIFIDTPSAGEDTGT